MKNFLHLLCCDMQLFARHVAEWAALVFFFVVVLLLLPFAIGPDAELLRRLGPGLIWLAVLLMILLAVDKLFVADARDGTLDLMLLSPLPLPLIAACRLLALIIVSFVLLAVMIAPASLMLGLDPRTLPVLLASLALGVPSLILVGGIAGAITAALSRNTALLLLLLAPFYIPVLIFAVSACDAAAAGANAAPDLLLLGALLLFLLPTAPLLASTALRNAQG